MSETLENDFSINPKTLKSNYLDICKGIHSEMIYSNRVDENSNLSTSYLGQTKMTGDTKIKAEEKFPVTGQGFTSGKLLDGSDCQILFDRGAIESYISKSYYLRCKCLHTLPKFASNTQRIQVGNRQYVGVLFVIPVIIDVHGHRFEIFTLVSEIHENLDLVSGIKKVFELEEVIALCDSCFSFLNRSTPFFTKEKIEVPPKVQKMVMIEAPFVEELSGMAIVMVFDMNEHVTNMIKLKFIRNRATLKITNNTDKTMTFNRSDMIGISDLKSLGYYKINRTCFSKTWASISF